ncbi:murein hydrolase activator EnvC family protein [Alkalimarinus alittae]|uniref:Peptidoglycan DD-metalloendopeptidase family protein n=1 Tax=Alkalimarinus alittae TaxID=2961619 RepID=A0ABY6N4I1_9ALTE|nr:peptidoglycan DD-metalloendopeptidase family protein [Alkalimarinus alittae]UZE97031.1 peptidoglycan DD-metalloendopeptidase family protein [Alkalimarinus alittae]
MTITACHLRSNNRLVIRALPFIVLLLLLFPISPSHLSAANSEPEVSPKQLKELKKTIGKLNNELDKAEGRKNELQKRLKQSELEISRIGKDIHKVQQQLNDAQKRLKALQVKKKALELQLKNQQSYLKKQIVTAYSLGRQPAVKVLLNLEDPQKIDRTLAYYDYFNKARAKEIESYRSTINQLSSTRTEIDQENEKLINARSQLVTSKSELNESQRARKRALAKLNSSIKGKSREIEKLTNDQKRLEKLLQEVEKAIAELKLPEDSRPFSQLKSKLPWPTHGKVTKYYGSRLAGGKLRLNGVIIETNSEVKVNAVHYGRIVFSDWIRGFGLMSIIDHGGGYMSLYGHNKSLLKDIGDWVRTGETIAYSGKSGGQKETGLYFEIRKNGRPQNPLKWLQRK